MNARSKLFNENNLENAQESKTGRKWNRKNCCPYCMKLITNFSRHIVKQHSDEEKVKDYLKILDSDLKVRKQKRTSFTNELRIKGNKELFV